MLIDTSKLENLQVVEGGWQAQCPACASVGNDSKNKNHLKIFRDTGKFSCVLYPSDRGHNKEILNLIGVDGFIGESGCIPPDVQNIIIDKIYDISLLNGLIKNYDYWKIRGISEDVIKNTKGGIASSGQLKDRWVIPVFNDRNDLIGFAGRALKHSMNIKWKLLGRASQWCYGGIEQIKQSKKLILVESFGDYAKLTTFGINNVLILWGLNMSQFLLGKIISLNPQQILISTNSDIKNHQAGQFAAEKIKRNIDKFFNDGTCKIALPIGAKDFGEMNEEQIKEWRKLYVES